MYSAGVVYAARPCPVLTWTVLLPAGHSKPSPSGRSARTGHGMYHFVDDVRCYLGSGIPQLRYRPKAKLVWRMERASQTTVAELQASTDWSPQSAPPRASYAMYGTDL
eukprot:3941810-Rhodomonas_salina.3